MTDREDEIKKRMTFALGKVGGERLEQLKKWGDQEHSPKKWLVILMEELGEAAKAVLEHNDYWSEELERELVQIAAVAVAAIEDYRR